MRSHESILSMKLNVHLKIFPNFLHWAPAEPQQTDEVLLKNGSCVELVQVCGVRHRTCNTLLLTAIVAKLRNVLRTEVKNFPPDPPDEDPTDEY